ncbi:Phenylalanine--trna ligase beta subunit [Thalictrum thalictroides]|uniref:phenylalanine--tRNA ligase n=1 Tax=Thalictrum thalictroides TaxID=46969 RepID=A0A7J6VUY9_THATH|nr:Phenylalanine--trna ligase beta subunit [Thalictrum thalictroides]
MPKVSVGRDRLFEALGREYTQEEFEDVCFEFGLELDDIVTEEDEVIYKVEVAANRYDLLCFEGLVRALRIFKGLEQIPKYTAVDIPLESMLKIHVKPETALVRPYVVCAVLRNITFDQASYKSFIDLQDMLHQNICRGRTLVAIGTHDLDTIQGPFTYEALPPTEINFVPLKQVKSFRGDELMKFYETDIKLKKFLHIIEKSPVFPVIYDCNRTVLSLPPIINGALSAISVQTKNVFIECTATDLTKAKIVLNTMVTMFSMYCKRKFEVEPVEVISSDGHSCVYPDLSAYSMEVPLSKITGRIGVSADANQVISLLNRMQLLAEKSVSSGDQCSIIISVPPTRSDVLESCDVAEDFAIAYGFENILAKVSSPSQGGGEQSLSQISNLIRLEFAMSGFTEVLTWILCSYKDITSMLNRKDNNSTSVKISNPRSTDFEVARTTLMPGLLKTVRENNHHPKPIKIFEVGDVVFLNEMNDVGARNRHHLAALYCDDHSGFEVIHGLVQRILEVMDIPCDFDSGYCIKASNEVEEGEFLPGTKGSIIHKGESVGSFGIVHPEVLNNFKISYPCSYMEIDLQCFFK